jgi:UDP-N-acetylglucosamine 2-epimerase (non-hydrolysing)
VTSGTAKLVGTDSEGLVKSVNDLLDDASAYARMAQARNPFGDGKAASRIVARLLA